MYYEFIIFDRSRWYFLRWGGGQGAKKCPWVEHTNADKPIYFRLKNDFKNCFWKRGHWSWAQEKFWDALALSVRTWQIVLCCGFFVVGWSCRNMKLFFFTQRNALQQSDWLAFNRSSQHKFDYIGTFYRKKYIYLQTKQKYVYFWLFTF